MKLLVVTQRINKEGDYFSFFHEWLKEFSKQCESVVAIGLEVGTYDLPKNVKVLSLGKETKKSKFQYIWRLLVYSWRERRSYDAVFAHMSPLFVIFGYPIWKPLNKRVGLWYVHKHVDLKLKIAAKLTDTVFTATPESFRVKSRKINYMGQAVPLEAYKRPDGYTRPAETRNAFCISSVGRITPIKDLGTLIKAAAILKEKGLKTRVDLIGQPVQPADHEYKKELEALVAKLNVGDIVNFAGKVAETTPWLWQSDLSVNLCPTGGLDKAVLESMAASTPVIVSNQAFRDYFGPYADRMMFTERDSADLAAKLEAFIRSTAAEKQAITAHLLSEVERRSSLKALIGRIASLL